MEENWLVTWPFLRVSIYQAFEVENFNLKKLTRKESISNYDFQGKLQPALPWKPGKTKLNQALNFTFRFPKRGKSGSTVVYQAYQAFNQTVT